MLPSSRVMIPFRRQNGHCLSIRSKLAVWLRPRVHIPSIICLLLLLLHKGRVAAYLSLSCCMLTAQLMQIRCPHTSLTGRQLISQQSGHAKSSNCGTTETRSCDSCEQTAFAIASGITEPGCIVLGNALDACSYAVLVVNIFRLYIQWQYPRQNETFLPAFACQILIRD